MHNMNQKSKLLASTYSINESIVQEVEKSGTAVSRSKGVELIIGKVCEIG